MATGLTKASGPIFDGRAERALQQYARDLRHSLAEIGQDWIQIEAMGMDKSGRGGTGRAAEGVRIITSNLQETLWGDMKEGEVWWPWLEGVSKRNHATRFKGYHTFRKIRFKITKYAVPYANAKIRVVIPRMNKLWRRSTTLPSAACSPS